MRDRVDLSQSHSRNGEAGEGPERRERQRFDEELRQDPATAGAERRPNRDLAKTRDCSRVKEDREVHGDDEHQCADQQLGGSQQPDK